MVCAMLFELMCVYTIFFCRPVIESQEFYRLFPTLKRRLDKQKLTHKTAGEFLHVVKTLMAKLKVRLINDALWEGLNPNFHRQMIGVLSHVRSTRQS